MITININPVAFSFGALSVHWYGLMYVVGIVVGLSVAYPFARSRGFTDDQLEKIVVITVPSGFVGARLYYVLQQPLSQYLHDPLRIIAVWEGGMAFYGAVFAVVLAIILLTWRSRLSLWKLLDVAAIFATVGQFFGRIGNLINGDVIGAPTGLPWGIVYTNPNSFAPRHDVAYQPAAIYEALLDVFMFGLLWWLRNRVRPGMLIFVYIFVYSFGQLLIFVWRDNVVIFAGLKQAQLTAIAVIIAAAIAFMWFYRRQPQPVPVESSEQPADSSEHEDQP